MNDLNVKRFKSIIAIGVLTISTLSLVNMINEDAYAIEAPKNIQAISIKDQYIRINWDTIFIENSSSYEENMQYEVYVIEGGKREYVGTTPDKGFVFTNLKGNTEYEFLVRALTHRNATIPDITFISNKVKTGSLAGSVDKDNKLGFRTKSEKLGQTANVIIGSDTLDPRNKKLNYNIDLTREKLSGSKEVVVSIPADVVMTKSEKLIKIIGNDFTLSFNPNVFENDMLKSNSDKSDVGVRFKIAPVNKNLILNNAKDNSSDIVSKKYILEAKTFVGSSSEEMDSLNGTMDLIMDYDLLRTKTRRLKNIYLTHYDSYDKSYEVIDSGENGTAIGKIDNLGTYLTIGTRR